MSNSDSMDISLSGFYKSWYAFRAGKRISRSIISFEYELENNLCKLAKDIQTNEYRHGGYRHLLVNDSKSRHIAVSSVRDRVVHRTLYDYFVPRTNPYFDYDVWSCRKNKGLEGAVERTLTLLKRYPDSWVWRGDVAKFFDSIDHAVLSRVVRRYIKDPIALKLLDNVTESYLTSPGVGIPIGNLTSQIISNIYMNEFDRFVRHYLKPLGYVRYGDDFILLFPNQDSTLSAQIKGSEFLDSRLKLTIHSSNNIVIPAKRGLYFLGMVLFPTGRYIQKRTWDRIQRRLNSSNVASYHGLVKGMGSKRQKKDFKWIRPFVLNFENVHCK